MIKFYKTLLFYSIVTLISCSYATAQVQYGFRVGGNLSRINIKNEEEKSEKSFKPRFNFAVLFNLPLSNSWSLQIEPGYTKLGGGVEYTDTGTSGNKQYEDSSKENIFISYLELPVLLQYRHRIGKIETIFSLGPEVRLLTKPARTKSVDKSYINGILDSEYTYDEEYGGEDGPKKLDYGLAAGVGVGFCVKNVKLFGEVKFHQGLANFVPSFEDTKATNQYASANFGILIPLKGVE